MIKSVVNPKFFHLEEELRKAVDGLIPVKKVFCNKRNTVELVEIGGSPMVIKRYKRQGWIKGLIYTLLRKTKAQRAYEYANFLNQNGFHSPEPVAYFEESSGGVFHEGFFIAEYKNFPSVLDLFFGEEGKQLPVGSPERKRIAEALSDFTLSLHQNGIQPLDYNMSNILIEDDGKEITFWLIDLNRMQIGRVPRLKKAMLSFFQLGTYYPDYTNLLHNYAATKGWDLETCIYYVIRHRRSFDRFRRFKRFFKKSSNYIQVD